MAEKAIILFLLCYSFVRELIFLYNTNKLINKLMSKSFHEYKYVDKLKKDESVKLSANENEVDEPEDYGALAGVG